MSFDKWAGEFIGVSDGLHAIGSGQAALFGFVFIALGWVISSRQQKEKYRVESARSTVMVENDKFQKYIPIIAPYFIERRPFPIVHRHSRRRSTQNFARCHSEHPNSYGNHGDRHFHRKSI